MLSALHIENIAVIEKTDINFAGGFNVLTGETGAGKSIIIDSINAILGERTSHDLIRTGAQEASVTAVFENISDLTLQILKDFGYECEDRSLVVLRKIYTDGRNNVKINGLPANVSVLKRISPYLINIHGQHDSQRLLDATKHIEYIDMVAENEEFLVQYQEAYQDYCETKSKLESLKSVTDGAKMRADYLRYVVSELEAAEIEVGEREELARQRDLIRDSATVAQQLTEAYNTLNGDDYNQGVSSVIKSVADSLQYVSKYIPDFERICEQLLGYSYEIDEVMSDIDSHLSQVDFNPSLLESIESRLDYLFRLSKKYGSTEEEMLKFLQDSKDELDTIDNSDEKILILTQELDKKRRIMEESAKMLSESRAKASIVFQNAVCEQLNYLDMPKAKFEVKIQKTDAYTSMGADQIEFFISANAGENLKPLAKVASGGELSRIMLSIKSVMADKDDVDTLIFDEIDSGISGSAARKVGIKIKETSKNRQVICVTHLAQIASLANVHFKISKQVNNGKTYTCVDDLSYSERVEEVARIMSTGVVTQAMRQSAAELMDE